MDKPIDIEKVFKENEYIMTTAQLNDAKIYYADIQRLMTEGLIEKIKQGYYIWSQIFPGSEVTIIKKLFPDAVLCMLTALFYYGYSDRNPSEWNLAIDKNTSRGRVKIDYPFIRPYRVEHSLLSLGETTGRIDCIEVSIYDRDRTICDMLRNINTMDKEIFNKSIQAYIRDSKKNIPNLMKYAKILRIEKRVKDLIGVWL